MNASRRSRHLCICVYKRKLPLSKWPAVAHILRYEERVERAGRDVVRQSDVIARGEASGEVRLVEHACCVCVRMYVRVCGCAAGNVLVKSGGVAKDGPG